MTSLPALSPVGGESRGVLLSRFCPILAPMARSSDAFGRPTPETLFANSTADRSGVAVLVDGMSNLREVVGEHLKLLLCDTRRAQ